MRSHYLAPIQSTAGAIQAGAAVSVFANGSTQNGIQQGTLIAWTVYADGTSSNALTNPFICTTGTIDFYLAYPLRVDLGLQVPGQAPVYIPDVDCDTNNSLQPTIVSQNYVLSLSDQLILASALAGNVTLTLPPATIALQYMSQ